MRSSFSERWQAACFAVTILLSAFLVFQVQPVISKAILPWFGGTPAVWTVCMLFFQVTLFAGYAYAHLSTRYLTLRLQGLVHLLLIGGAILTLPIAPDLSWKPSGGEDPTWRILALLSVSVGMPYFVLSSSGPLLQAWFSAALTGRSPYRLYALSNAGSLLALISYPFVVEPAMATGAQGQIWSLGFVVFALFSGGCALRMWSCRRPAASAVVPSEVAGAACSLSRRAAWLCLAACASIMLLAITNHVCQDVAVIPFLWVVPLSLYLVSFIICFDNERWYSRRWFSAGTALCVLAASLLTLYRGPLPLSLELGVYLATLFCVCMLCHGELVRLKPAPQHLTSFYLMCAAGGALGGILVGLVAPAVFPAYWELNLGLALCYALAALVLWSERPASTQARSRWTTISGAVLTAGLLAVVRCQTGAALDATLVTTRNFYGILHVNELDSSDPARHGRALRHSRVLHGFQYLSADKRRTPTTYYNRQSGVGLALERSKQGDSPTPRRVGVVGLGVGTLAAYGEKQDYLRFYEINSEVLRLAEQHFSFIKDCTGQVDVVLGDARISMEREAPQKFDVLVLDAFSGDAIPTHLLTREAFESYLRHVKPDGIIAIHITNRYVNLRPVMRGLADHFHFETAMISTKTDVPRAITASDWLLFARDEQAFSSAVEQRSKDMLADAQMPAILWTDDYSNVFQILR